MKIMYFPLTLTKIVTKQDVTLILSTNHFLGILYDVKNNVLCGEHVRPFACDLSQQLHGLSYFQENSRFMKISAEQANFT
jgi:hypothetical protein